MNKCQRKRNKNMDCITIKIPQGSSIEAGDKYKQLLWTEYNSRVEVTLIFFKCKNNNKKKDKAYKKIFKYDGIKIYKARVQSICVVHSRRTAAISCQYLFITFLIRRFPHHLNAERKKDNKMSVQKETIVFLPSNP